MRMNFPGYLAKGEALVVVACVLLSLWEAKVNAQTNAPAPEVTLASQEREACMQNLKVIYSAIQKYQLDHKDIPNWLSDLVPDYLSDVNVLTCPVCRRTGRSETKLLADPKLPSSYLFEFCPVPLGQEVPEFATKTRREWKRRQMGLAGS